MANKTRKINVTLSLEVDVDEWSETYGLFPTIVPADVKEYVHNLVQGCSAGETGLIQSVTLR